MKVPESFYRLNMIFDLGKLRRRGLVRNLPMWEDVGYLVHMQLGELFGGLAPRPFRIDRHDDQLIRILAYSDKPASLLKSRADVLADPPVHSICDWSSFAGKSMPNLFKPGQLFGFELRACPVVRLAKAGMKITRNGGRIQVKKGAEVDVFVQQAWVRPDEKLDREAIYREWLEGQFERRGAASLMGSKLKAFRIEKLIRRNHATHRKSYRIERPDAQLEGEVEITDGEAFANMLRAGIGRHRGFGFGMLVLRDG